VAVFLWYNKDMKILVEKINESMISALRRCGYHFERNIAQTAEVSAARSFGPSGFPRFHCYAKKTGENMEINLHLDQKKPIYRGTSAHGGEYEGEIIEQEMKRIAAILSPSQ
jgi:hypothetical protein